MGLDEMLGGQGTVIRTSFIADSKGMDKAAAEMKKLARRAEEVMRKFKEGGNNANIKKGGFLNLKEFNKQAVMFGKNADIASKKFVQMGKRVAESQASIRARMKADGLGAFGLPQMLPGKNNGAGFQNIDTVFQKATRGARRFKMELLGIMFFGMAMQRMFKGAVGPAADAFGLGELWDTTKLILFLPLMEAIFPYLLGLMEFIMNLPQPVKLAIGALTLFIGALGGFLTIFGAIGLGIASLKLAFPALATAAVSTSAIMNATLVGALIAVGFWLNSTAQQMGGWGNFFKNALSGVINYVIMLSGWFGTLVKGIGELLSKTLIFKSISDSMQMVGNKISSLAEDAAIGFQSMREDSTSWWSTTVQNNVAVGNSFTNLAVDAEKAFRRIELAYGYAFGSQVQGAVSSAKTAKGAFELLGYSASTGASGGVVTQAGSYKNNPNAWKPKTTHGDFIWRAGQGAIGISPDDNLVGTKKGMGGTGGITINQTINVGSAQRDEMSRMINENNKRLLLDVKRLVSG